MENESSLARASCVSAFAPGLHLPFNSRFLSGINPSTIKAVFLDRDGVLVRDVHYLKNPSQIELVPDIIWLSRLPARFYLVIATNQSGIARNLFTEGDLLLIHSELIRQLAAQGVLIDALYYCPHLPTASNPAYRVACNCRKPGPAMFHRAEADWGIDLKRSYMIGDSPRDVEASNSAGLAESILVSGPDFPDNLRAYRRAPTLAAAVQMILEGSAG